MAFCVYGVQVSEKEAKIYATQGGIRHFCIDYIKNYICVLVTRCDIAKMKNILENKK